MEKVPRRKVVLRLLQMAGVLMVVGGIAVFSLPVAAVVFGLVLVVVGEVHG